MAPLDSTFLIKKLPSVGNFFVETLFPASCYGCGKADSYLCSECCERALSTHPICPHCSRALPNGHLGEQCQRTLALDRLYTIADYKNRTVGKLIRDMKYRLSYKLADSLADMTHRWLVSRNYIKDFHADMIIIPVPSHKRKQKERGFNPAERIARRLAPLLALPHKTNILIKTIATPSQVKVKNRTLRLENIRGSFSVYPNHGIKGKTILLIDDVITTGSTMRECTRVLKKAGARAVWGLAVARD